MKIRNLKKKLKKMIETRHPQQFTEPWLPLPYIVTTLPGVFFFEKMLQFVEAEFQKMAAKSLFL